MLKQAPAKRFEELIVWQKSHQLTLAVYRITALMGKVCLPDSVSSQYSVSCLLSPVPHPCLSNQ
jgi:hypothetical protein